MAAVYIATTIDFSAISKNFIKANDVAVTYTAAKALTALKAAQPVRTGEMQSEVGIKFFKQKNKMRGASLKVIGERYRVSAILENGTKDGRIKARHTFDRTAVQIESFVESTYTTAFFDALEQLGEK